MIYAHIYPSGPIVVMILEKQDAVLGNRMNNGSDRPKKAEEGTIRKKIWNFY